MTETSSGSPMGSNISGRNTPELPTSTHFFRPMRIYEGKKEGERKGREEVGHGRGEEGKRQGG